MTATESVVQPTISERAAKLHRDAIVIDGLAFYYDGPTSRFDPDKLTALNLTACETHNAWDKALEEIMQVRDTLKRDPIGMLIRSAADIEDAKVDRKVGVILGVQSTIFIDTELWHLDLLYDIGLRIMQLTYNERSYMGDGCLEPEDGGLSRFGRRAIARLEDLGIALDLSHAGRRTSLDAIAAASVPVMFSHANPNKITQNPRNLTDEQIKALGENGGMIGVCTWGPLCWKNDPTKRPTIDDVIDHIDHVVEMIGIDHVGIGTDSGCTANTARLIEHDLEFNSAYPEIASEFVSHHGRSGGMPEVNSLDRMTDGLLNRGYTDGDVIKVIGGNFLRHFRTVWRA